MPKTMSLQQLDANRRNSRKSTGPKTPKGRAISKMNALKHGILSKEVLVCGMNIRECSQELSDLHERFRQELNPAGPLEEMLVDQIVTTHWRLRRALRAESGEIALSVDEGQWQRSRPNPHLQWMEWEVWGDPVPAMKDSSSGNAILASWLGRVRARVEQEGDLTEETTKILLRGKPNMLSQGLEELRLRLPQNSEGADAASQREENKKQALAYIDSQLEMLAWAKVDCLNREATAEAARQAAAVLPAMPVLEKILRYEAKLERQMYRAMSQLERLQRMRRGEAVPPAMRMEVSERP
jgi:hypothetical protein